MLEQKTIKQPFILLQFHRNNPTNYSAFTIDQIPQIPKNFLYDQRFRTVFYVYGFTGQFKDQSVQTLVEAYASRKDHNLIIVNWEGYNGSKL